MTKAEQVHQAIMNLPREVTKFDDDDLRAAYKMGHKEVRHAAAELAQQAVAECERRIAELEGSRDMYRTMFNHALDCVDRVFQVDSTKPSPLLPDFLGLGECKFKGVIKLAEEYLRLKGPTP